MATPLTDLVFKVLSNKSIQEGIMSASHAGEETLSKTEPGKAMLGLFQTAQEWTAKKGAELFGEVHQKPIADKDVVFKRETPPLIKKGIVRPVQGKAIPFTPVVYHPDVYKIGSDKFKAAVSHIVATGQEANVGDAEFGLKSEAGAARGRGRLQQMYYPKYKLPLAQYGAPEDYVFGQWSKAVATATVEHKVYGPQDINLHRLIKAATDTSGSHAHRESLYQLSQLVLHDRSFGSQQGVHAYGESQGEVESKIRGGFSRALTPLIAIPHMGQWVNNFLDKSVPNIVKGLADSSSKHGYTTAKAEVFATGAMFDETFNQLMRNEIKQPNLLDKFYHQPGFAFERKLMSILSGSMSKYEAIDLAERLSKNPNDFRANGKLKYYGIEPKMVIANKGKLSQDMIDTAVQRGIANVMFERSALKTPYAWEKNLWTRSFSLYKHYAFNEGRLVVQNIKTLSVKDPARFAQVIATLGVLFPLVGEGTHMIGRGVEYILTGGNPSPDKDTVDFKDNPMAWYVDKIGHIAAFGLWVSAYQAVQKQRLLAYLAGPEIEIPTRLVQDLMRFNVRDIAKTSSRIAGPLGKTVNEVIDNVFPKTKHRGHYPRKPKQA